jgi:hypothetical protein
MFSRITKLYFAEKRRLKIMPPTGFTSYPLPKSRKSKTRKAVPTTSLKLNRYGKYVPIKKRANIYFNGPAIHTGWCASCKSYSIKPGDMYGHCIEFGQTASFCANCCVIPKNFECFVIRFSLKRGQAWKTIYFVGTEKNVISYEKELKKDGRIVKIHKMPITGALNFDTTAEVDSRQSAEASQKIVFEKVKEIQI